ncbi:DUF3341 domain-containing protein [Phycisphaerales bacterium AB-hyl4]|uniref:DUF3341 domain-containing protein n=1 Tax=Natronomicrosphaera hydrolytica TaxID=3242702 RepID=A0ABV4U1V2_9BACT
MTQANIHTLETPETGELEQEEVYALLAEFEDVDGVKSAAHALKGEGYRLFDVHSPFPIHGLDHDLNITPTILPWIVLGGGLTGMAAGLVLTIWTQSIDYPFLVSGKPLNSMPAWIPIVFELTILLSAFGAVFGMLVLNKLPLLSQPLLQNERFRRATDDRFFITVLTTDKHYDRQGTAEFLEKQGAAAVEAVTF